MTSRSDPSRPSPAQASIAGMLGPLDGARIPGGCAHCDAYQTVSPVTAGMWDMTVYHDDWCPFWLARQTRTTPEPTP